MLLIVNLRQIYVEEIKIKVKHIYFEAKGSIKNLHNVRHAFSQINNIAQVTFVGNQTTYRGDNLKSYVSSMGANKNREVISLLVDSEPNGKIEIYRYYLNIYLVLLENRFEIKEEDAYLLKVDDEITLGLRVPIFNEIH